MRILIFLIVIIGACSARAAETVSIAPDVSIITAPGSGEAQSTVVAPGRKNECPNGRFVASNDARRPPAAGLVQGRNLNDLNGAAIQAKFDGVPHPENYSFVTNDHDLVSLANGDILYITGAASRAPLAAKPAWFDVAYRGNFGPGARSVVLVWRSTDCGETFAFASEFDPARVLDGSCAFPQMPRKITAPGSEAKPVYDMGGADGQLAKVDLNSGRVYMTFSCVGYLPDKTQSKAFELSKTRLNKTLVVSSLDGGESWTAIGTIKISLWRGGLVPRSGDRVAFGVSTGFVLGQPTPEGNLAIERHRPAGFRRLLGLGPELVLQNNTIPKDLIYANLWASTIVARAGASSKLLLAFPTTVVNAARSATHATGCSFSIPTSPAIASSIRSCRRCEVPITSSCISQPLSCSAGRCCSIGANFAGSRRRAACAGVSSSTILASAAIFPSRVAKVLLEPGKCQRANENRTGIIRPPRATSPRSPVLPACR